MNRCIVLAAAVVSAAACSSSSQPAARHTATTVPGAAEATDSDSNQLTNPETMGPADGEPCDFANDGVPLFAPTGAPPKAGDTVLLAKGHEPRTTLRRGDARPVLEPWSLKLEQTLDMGVQKVGRQRFTIATQFAVESRPEESRMRYLVTDSRVVDSAVEGGEMSDEERRTFADGMRQVATAVGTYVDVGLNDRHQPFRLEASGDPKMSITGTMLAIAAQLPSESVGVGTQWLTNVVGEGLRVFANFIVADVREGVVSLEAQIMMFHGPMRLVVEGERQEYWALDHLNETWTLDPRTPVTAFRGTRSFQSFIARCREGRIAVHRVEKHSTVTFAPAS